ncbi:hypothetical protein [Dyella subtropica]|uniref:hypothetical protein n=1 Tax=Dyella subtropica TaxID=2992127 RepID=UPI002254B016|nr:hypothetical protein [Dyella subtropica]
MVRLFATAVVVLVLAGCATTNTRYSKIDQNAIASFKPGATTMAEAEAVLGKPFQSAQMPDGTEQLEYLSKVQDSAADAMPITGTAIPRRVDKIVATMLSFDKGGHFISSWSNTSAGGNPWPSDLGKLQSGDFRWAPGR